MATPEQIAAFAELDRRGYFKDKDQAVVQELRKRFGTSASEPLGPPEQITRTIDQPEGAKIEVTNAKPNKYDTFYPDKGEPVDLNAPIIKTFRPDLPSGANAPQEPVDLANEALNEEAGKYLKSNLDAITFGIHFGDKHEKAIEEASGVPREQKIPFWQDQAASAALNIGQGEGIGTLFKATVGKTALGRFLMKPIMERKAAQVAADAVDSLAPQAVKDEAARLAARTPDEVVRDVVKSATAEIKNPYDKVQHEIDLFEDTLVKKGVNITKMAPESELSGLPSDWVKMPTELEKLYNTRDAIGAKQLSETISTLGSKLKDVGLKNDEIKSILAKYSITDTSPVGQSLAAKWAQIVANQTPKQQAERLAYTLSELRGEPEISKSTKLHAIKAVREITDYFGTWGKEVPVSFTKSGFLGMPTTANPLGEMTGEKAGAINLDYLNTPDKVKAAITELSKQAPKVFKGDTVPVEDMISAAQDLGITEADILSGKIKPDSALHPKILAARQIMVKAAEDMSAAKEKLLTPNATPEDLVNFKIAFEKARDISGYVRSSISEVARTLRSQQIAVGSQEYRQKALQQVMKSMEGREVTDAIAKRFASIDVNNPREVAMFVREMASASTMDKVFEGWRNFLLSGTMTPVRNAIGDTIGILTRGAEKTVAPVMDVLTGGGTLRPRERFFSELPAEIQAHTFGIWDGLKNARVAFQQELPIFGFDKFAEAAQGVAIKGTAGKIIRIPQRLAMSADEIFKTVLYQGQLSSEAYRAATKEGLKGAALVDRIAQLKLAPTEDMIKAAESTAQHYTFQDPMGPIGKWMAQGRRTIPGLRYVLPFIQVAANIPKWTLQRTPLYLPFIRKKVVQGELAGGKIADELAKVAVGTLASVPIFQHAWEGSITGYGPVNKSERNVWLTTHQPYSVKIGNQWHQVKNVDPAGLLVGSIGDMHDIWNRLDQESATLAIGIAIAKNSTNATYMSSLRDILDAVTDPERNGKRFITRFVGGAVPNVLASLQRANDPKDYAPETISQAVQARIPFIDKTDLPPVLDIWGRPVIREGTFASRMFWPVSKQTIPDDPATLEVSRLNMSMGSPAKKVEGIPLSPHQYLFYAQYAGREAQRIVNLIIQNPAYQQLSDTHKEDAIQQAVSTARDKAKAYLLQSQPDIIKQIVDLKKKKANE